MIYENNEQVKNIIKEIMKREKVTYRDLAEKLETSQQNIYSIVNKKQLKLDDILMVCNALGYAFEIKITKENTTITSEDELTYIYINDEVLMLLGKLMKIAKDTDIDSVTKRYHAKNDIYNDN